MIYLLGRLDDADAVDQALDVLKYNCIVDVACLHEFPINDMVDKYPHVKWLQAGLNYFSALKMALGKEESATVFSPHLVCSGFDIGKFQQDVLMNLRAGGTCVVYLANIASHLNVAIGCRPQTMRTDESPVDKYFIQQYIVSTNRCHARGVWMDGFIEPNLRPLERYTVVRDRRMVERFENTH